MWKPDKPIVLAGETLTDSEAWRREFGNAFHALCAGEVDHEWLASITHVSIHWPLSTNRAAQRSWFTPR